MSTPASKPSEAQRSLLRFLQREGKIAAADVVRLEKEAQEKGLPIAEALEAAGIISERDLAALMAATLRLRQIDLTAYPFDPGLARELKEAVATRYEIVPLRVDGRTIGAFLTVAAFGTIAGHGTRSVPATFHTRRQTLAFSLSGLSAAGYHQRDSRSVV